MEKIYKFIEKTTNSKLGKIACTYTSISSCPNTCKLKDKACYAQTSYVGSVWSKLSKGNDSNALNFKSLIEKIKALPENSILRMNVAGDLPVTKKGKLNKSKLKSLKVASKHLNVINFTHHKDYSTIKQLNDEGYTLIHSLDSLKELNDTPNDIPFSTPIKSKFARDKRESLTQFKSRIYRDLKQLRENYPENKLILCPATYLFEQEMNCEKCKICTKLKPKEIVMFPSHGTRKNKLDNLLK